MERLKPNLEYPTLDFEFNIGSKLKVVKFMKTILISKGLDSFSHAKNAHAYLYTPYICIYRDLNKMAMENHS